jgi:hypothetical protein
MHLAEQPALKYVGVEKPASEKASSENEADAIGELPGRFSAHNEKKGNADIYSIHGEQARSNFRLKRRRRVISHNTN